MFGSDTVKRLLVALASAMALALCLSMLVAPTSANASALSEDEVKAELLAQSEIQEVADHLGVKPEIVVDDLVSDLGVQAASDVSNYISRNDINVNKNFAEVEAASQSESGLQGPIDAQKTCAKAATAASLFGIFGTAICGAAAASSVGALGVPCTLILTIGSSSLDWGKVCD